MPTVLRMIEIVRRAADKAGGVTKLAAALGIKHPSLHSWQRVPAERVLELEQVTGISRHELRPDLYPNEIAREEAAVSAEISELAGVSS